MATKHDDMAQDKQAIRAAVHKHEAALHKGKPKTALKKGGMVARGTGAAIKGTRFSRDG